MQPYLIVLPDALSFSVSSVCRGLLCRGLLSWFVCRGLFRLFLRTVMRYDWKETPVSGSEKRALKRSAMLEVALFAHERASRLVLKAGSYHANGLNTVGEQYCSDCGDSLPENVWYLSIPVKGRLHPDGAGHRANKRVKTIDVNGISEGETQHERSNDGFGSQRRLAG